MGKYRCIVWDWNGTLFDDMNVCIDVMNGLLDKRSLPLLDVRKYREFFDFPIVNYYRKLGFDFEKEPFEKISSQFIAGYQKRSLSCGLYSDSAVVLDYFRNIGLRQVILSASQIENLEEQVRHFGIYEYFDRLLGLDHCHATSKVEIGKNWLKECGFDKKELVLIGDTVHDHEVAAEIGCDCILLLSGHQSRERLSVLGVPVIETLIQVKDLI